jgi:hypothetical protein
MQLPFDHLSLEGSARTNRYGRHVHGNYFASTEMDDLGATHPDGIQWRIDTMREYVTRLGFDSVFDAATATAQSDSPHGAGLASVGPGSVLGHYTSRPSAIHLKTRPDRLDFQLAAWADRNKSVQSLF